ncbi:lipid transporter ATP-binding/permease protein [Cupriavidus basilensis OR16]|uniref:Lipid transporter ATP-binding/permease protein n=1 Tax=Cupriavidus basilensis OR16 TaxID=1127483 RepID=H1SA40_9BURK|nr:lipid transporter ATP-binding/permease protein [Cupriavidus basilensis OR16]
MGALLADGACVPRERQRIAIARALLCDAPILVLDEASSSIDAESEQALHVAMARLRKTRTLIVIAHRPTTIRQADRIVVLEDRRVVETGRHAELLTRQGAYARLLAQCGESTQLPAGSQTR